MGQTKKAYMDWCEKHDKNPNEDEMQAMQDLDEAQWQKEYDEWLDDVVAESFARDAQWTDIQRRFDAGEQL
jgi:hypothetical protein